MIETSTTKSSGYITIVYSSPENVIDDLEDNT